MHADAEKEGPRFASKGDERVTRVGRFLRATHLDELPQLWNVLVGDMSIVGPRPERPYFVKRFAHIPRYMERLKVKPGITGLAQLNAPYDEKVKNKLRYDLLYIRSYSVWLDVKLVLKTLWLFLAHRWPKQKD
jgi:lipopolysaccharide/colanic/teichoic acid biosynthesis glycosyltransferase